MPQVNLPYIPETITVHLGTPDSDARSPLRQSLAGYAGAVAELGEKRFHAALSYNIVVEYLITGKSPLYSRNHHRPPRYSRLGRHECFADLSKLYKERMLQ